MIASGQSIGEHAAALVERGGGEVIKMSQPRRTWIAVSVAAGTFSMIVLTTLSSGDTGQVVAQAGPAATYRPQDPAPLVAATVSCKELKDRLQSAGTLDIVPEQKSWSETFYGPEVPQCQFWQRPQFMYVNTNDGSCGLGYICVQRVTGGR